MGRFFFGLSSSSSSSSLHTSHHNPHIFFSVHISLLLYFVVAFSVNATTQLGALVHLASFNKHPLVSSSPHHHHRPVVVVSLHHSKNGFFILYTYLFSSLLGPRAHIRRRRRWVRLGWRFGYMASSREMRADSRLKSKRSSSSDV